MDRLNLLESDLFEALLMNCPPFLTLSCDDPKKAWWIVHTIYTTWLCTKTPSDHELAALAGLAELYTGFARSGKDTMGNFRRAEGYDVYAFADVLREVAGFILNYVYDIWPLVTRDIFLNAKTKEVPLAGCQLSGKPLTPRWLLQWFGVWCRENVEADIWINNLLARVVTAGARKIAITDMRFHNERALGFRLEALGWTVIAVRVINRTAPSVSHSETLHESERHIQALEKCTELINDMDGISKFYLKWEAVMGGLSPPTPTA